MKRIIAAITINLLCVTATVNAGNPRVMMETTKGNVIIELYPDNAPVTVENFLRYTREGKYDGTIFHRVIKGFMNQGGGYTPDFKPVETYPPIKSEADNGLKNKSGTIAMARTSDPDSATNQFFINTADNDFLDYTARTPQGWGYTVFGRIVEGEEVMDRIARVRTSPNGPFTKDVPMIEIVIRKMSISGDSIPITEMH